MVSDAFPVLCRIAVDPSAGGVSTSNRDFPTPHPFGRATDPPCAHVRRIAPRIRVDDSTARIDEEDLVPRIRKAQRVAFHLTRVARPHGEIGRLQRVLGIARGVSRDEEATSRRKD